MITKTEEQEKAEELVLTFGKCTEGLNPTWSQAANLSILHIDEVIHSHYSCVDCAEEGSRELAKLGRIKRILEKMKG